MTTQAELKMATPLDGFSSRTRAVCIGSGRFLRAVLVPVLQRVGCDVVLFQTRGVAFADACAASGGRYEVDTIHHSGEITTETLQLEAVGSLGRDDDRRAFFALPAKLPGLQFVGLGVTDAGITSGSSVMKDLAQFLHACFVAIPENILSIINTDNVPLNGNKIKSLVLEARWPGRPDGAAWQAFETYLHANVHFHNTMVDRLTSHRAADVLVPLAEPLPSKVLAIQDSAGVLDVVAFSPIPGVFIRSSEEELLLDQKLKLRIANATSSALVYVLALSRYKTNNEARNLPDVLAYRDGLFQCDILPSLVGEGVSSELAERVYDEWKQRSSHPHFGLVNLWVTQNAWLHFQARLFSTIRANVAREDPSYRVSEFMVFVAASILRFLTPFGKRERGSSDPQRTVYIGEMDAVTHSTPDYSSELPVLWTYGGSLQANLVTGEYEFMDAPQLRIVDLLVVARDAVEASQVNENEDTSPVVVDAIASAMLGLDGFDRDTPAFSRFVNDVAVMYTQLLIGKIRSSVSILDVLHDVVTRSP